MWWQVAEFWKSKGFKSLSKEWELRLTGSGFSDAEEDSKGERSLKQRADNCYRQASSLERETRLEYFSVLGSLAHATEFDDDIEAFIMLRHSEGAIIKEIVDELEARGIKKFRKTVSYIIRRWQMRWGLRTWTRKEMNLK